ncbi:cell division protein FtsQ/DivIB [Fastidiosibacter lacustris]|uniref:cell division protein FtsQ/DivIB n=1 Tax=Fastidiosibacter lacustris TaxID=2056695 RepID=UPI000E350B9A|nr:cell division protein FtsQ/DivIB [Fastidiosibacter lacustris]
MRLRLYFKLFCFIVIIVGVVLGFDFVFKQYGAHLQQVNVLAKGELGYISKVQIIDLIKPFQKDTWWMLSVKEIETTLRSYPGIKNIKVQKKWPNELLIELTEYKAQAYWNTSKQILLENNEIITPKYLSETLSLPTFNGDPGDIPLIVDRYQKLQDISKAHQRVIKQILYQGNQWKVVLDNEVNVWLGSKNIENKFKQLLENYQNIAIPESQKIESIDMRYQNGFAVRFVKPIENKKID